jgi:hypothetical protein
MDIEDQTIGRTPVDLFLESIGLSEYSELMKENDITEIKILSELSESDFEKMGISSLGHRKKLLSCLRDQLKQDKETSTISETVLVPDDTDKKKGSGGIWAVVGVLIAIVLIIMIVGAL